MKAARASEPAGVAHKQVLSRWVLVLLVMMGLGAAEHANGQTPDRGFDGAHIAICTR
jgi:hypothetical protein